MMSRSTSPWLWPTVSDLHLHKRRSRIRLRRYHRARCRRCSVAGAGIQVKIQRDLGQGQAGVDGRAGSQDVIVTMIGVNECGSC